jgi:hypothetical protein
MRLLHRCVTSSCALLFCPCLLSAQDGAALYKKNCALCHDARVEHVPNRETLKAMSPERVLAAMESGAMISFGQKTRRARCPRTNLTSSIGSCIRMRAV